MTHYNDTQAPPLAVLEAARRWGLVVGESTGSRYSHTWFATRGSEHVVIKAGDLQARLRETATLQAYQRGAAVLDWPRSPACELLDEALGESVTLLLERVVPGYDLRPLARADDDAATAAIGQVIAALHTATAARELFAANDSRGGAGVPELADIADAFDPTRRHSVWPVGGPPPGVDAGLLDRARGLLRELTHPTDVDIVLHGDLHHANVVCDGGPAWRGGVGPERQDWRAIDPHGWYGDPHFDTVSMLLDIHATTPQAELSDAEVRRLTRRRAEILADITALDIDRILAWVVVGGVISELWCLADHGFVQGPPHRLAALF